MFIARYSKLTSLQFRGLVLAIMFALFLFYFSAEFAEQPCASDSCGSARGSASPAVSGWGTVEQMGQPCQVSRTVSKKECKVAFKRLFAAQTCRHSRGVSIRERNPSATLVFGYSAYINLVVSFNQ